ncbi:MAG: T9SS type B sorting domain-containing protein, partial [Saprospiraceae bacterium]|nr:T9SS type B sorting domain-containing protein [Saprospiraceae bacterium]
EAPFTGAWLPENPFSNLYDQGDNTSPVNGIWTLAIKDDGQGFTGDLINWSIAFKDNYEINYSWSPTNDLSCSDCPDPIADPSVETTYTLSVTDIYGCLVEDSVVVRRGLIGASELVDSVSCFGFNDGAGTFSLTEPGTAPYQIEWFDGIMDSIHIDLTAGIYEVSIQDASGCDGVVEVTIPEPTVIELSTSAVDLCPDASGMGTVSVTASGGSPGYTYQWDANAGMAMTQTVSMLSAGVYSVIVQDANDCSATDMATITVAPDIEVFLLGDTITCEGTPVDQLVASASGGNGYFNYSLSDGLGMDSIAMDVIPGDYQVTATDQNSCEEVLDFSIVDAGDIVLDLNLVNPSCPNTEDGEATITSADINGTEVDLSSLSFSWSHGSGSPTSVTQLPGNTPITLSFVDENSCQSDTLFQLETPLSFSIVELENSSVSCFGGNNGSLEISLSGGVGNLSYSWPQLGGSSLVQTDLIVGDYLLQVVDDGLNCPPLDTVFTIAGPDEIMIIDTMGFEGCGNEEAGFASLSLSGGTSPFEILWSNGQSGPELQNVAPGMYSFTIQDANACDTLGEILIPAVDSIFIDTHSDGVDCREDTDGILEITVDGANPPYSYSLDGENFITNPQFVGLAYGFHDVHVMDSEGCIFTYDDGFVSGPAPFSIDLGPDQVVQLGDNPLISIQITDGQGDGTNWEWNWGLGDTERLNCVRCTIPRVIEIQESQIFNLTIIDDAGCIATDDIEIRVEKPRLFFVPTVFSPNGDSFNDLLISHGDGRATVDVFRLYDRWGSLLFETKDFSVGDETIGWDGSFRGQDLPPAVYVWYASVTFSDGEVLDFKGETTLIRLPFFIRVFQQTFFFFHLISFPFC